MNPRIASGIAALLFLLLNAASAAAAGNCIAQDTGGTSSMAAVDAFSLVRPTLQKLGSAVQKNQPCAGCVTDPFADCHFARTASLSLAQCLPPPVEPLCAKAINECRKFTFDGNCSHALGDPIPCISDDKLLAEHEVKFKYAARKFHAIVNDEGFQRRCCGKDGACRKNWASTPFRILKGLGADDFTAHTRMNDRGAVEISTGVIANCATEDCLDRLLFHELAHACRYWHYSSSPDKRNDPPNFQSDLKKWLGNGEAGCVLTQLQSDFGSLDSEERLRVNFPQWVDEALATAFFADQLGAAGLSWECNSIRDGEHDTVKPLVKCFFGNPGFSAVYCAGSGK